MPTYAGLGTGEVVTEGKQQADEKNANMSGSVLT